MSSSVDIVPARCSGGHGLNPVGDSLSHARVMLINSLFTTCLIIISLRAVSSSQLSVCIYFRDLLVTAKNCG